MSPRTNITSRMKNVAVISVFAGAGGFDCGLAAAGLLTSVAVDSDPRCIETLKLNSVRNPLCRDVSELSGRELLQLAKARRRGSTLMSAGLPCQPFSKSANWRHGRPLGLKDERADTIKELVRLVREALPLVVLIENVEGFATAGGLKKVKRALAYINSVEGTKYRLSWAVLDAADFGVPQHRRRLIAVAHRNGRAFKFPRPTHGPSSPDAKPYATAWDAIGGMQPPKSETLDARGRWAELLPSIPEGRNYLFHTARGEGVPLFGWRTRYWNFLLKLAKSRPAWTLAASPAQNAGPFHWDNRELSTMEAQRLQSFPRAWSFAGGREDRIRQIGNAVPPLLAEQIGLAIRQQFFCTRASELTAPSLSIGSRPSKPTANRRRRVSHEFLKLEGRYAAHPGPGLGPGALARKKKNSAKRSLHRSN